MPLVLPKRCPRCAVRVNKLESGYWLCPTCGWSDDPALNPWQPQTQATPMQTEASTTESAETPPA